jgi:hypothetical protein
MVRASKYAWAAVDDLRHIERDALAGTPHAFMLEEALRATEELAMELEDAETGGIEA